MGGRMHHSFCTGFQQAQTLMLPAFERPVPLPNLLHVKAREWGSASLQHLYAVVVAVAHDDASLAVNCNAPGTVEQPIAATFTAAKGSNVAAVAVSQNLHPMIIVIGHDDVTGTIKRDSAGFIEFPCA